MPNRNGIEVVHLLPQLYQSIRNLFPNSNSEEIVDMTTNIINQVRNVVDLSVTGMTGHNLRTFWGTLEKFKNLTSLEVAMAPQSSITLQDCGHELKKNLKRLRLTAQQFSIGSSSAEPRSGLENLGAFRGLIDLTLTSHTTIQVIDNIPCIRTLRCLRLYGDSTETFCKIELEGFYSLKKLVIGHMRLVRMVQIGSAVIKTIDTLKLYNLKKLTEVVYSDYPYPLLKWNTGVPVCAETIKLDETTFLRKFAHFPANKRNGLTIYDYLGKNATNTLCASQLKAIRVILFTELFLHGQRQSLIWFLSCFLLFTYCIPFLVFQ